ncbi:alpha/beta fold hydrolase [Ciceribacter sp. L1K23]|uniref:alpha/beta hydrolase family protein n=1 Tax=Ciceribacter sp. L1K23 TaxID=2820276 RepID=UPI001B844C5C|nr:alpha/beta fold hydrolase [Ciceribacter sp. L1K23]MBR0557114.1 alpha/beta fold hydrolase [Ciceribacter sp. L1K23]
MDEAAAIAETHVAGRPEAVTVTCADGVKLGGHLWRGATGSPLGRVIINPATGVAARYYHRYAQFLAAHGFEVLTYDYRGIALSRPERLRGCGYRWRDWGEQDFRAALDLLLSETAAGPVLVVGHSIGGYLPGLADNARLVDRMLTVGAQYAWWRDYDRRQRLRLFLKWHVAMPALTAACGYFPGKRLGWLEDLPSGVALEWAFRGRRMEDTHPRREREDVLRRFAEFRGPILAIGVTDDALATPRAIRRTLDYYRNADHSAVLLSPADLGFERLGHFDLFHDRHAGGFWIDSLLWLRDGLNPWPDKRMRP